MDIKCPKEFYKKLKAITADFSLTALLADFRPQEFYKLIYNSYSEKICNELLSCFDDDQSIIIEKAVQLLANHWEKIKGTSLSFTAQPEDIVTKLLINFSLLISDSEYSAIKLLMPDLNLESISDDYADLDKVKLDTHLLKTHISGENCLIPIRCLISYEQSRLEGSQQGYFNPYYKSDSQQTPFISKEEYRRLINHSGETQAFHDAVNTLIEYQQRKLDLLSQVFTLCRALQLNDAHGGDGKPGHAGEKAYVSILKFYEYYQKLSVELKAKIPLGVKSEIDQLISSAAQKDTTLCIGAVRERLQVALQNEDTQEILQAISLEAKPQLEEAIEKYETTKKILQESLGQTNGYDHLNLNATIYEWLKIDFRISMRHHLQLFMDISAPDMEELLSYAPSLKREISSKIYNSNDLEGFIFSGHSHSKLKVILPYIMSPVTKKINRFRMFARSMTPEKLSLFMETQEVANDIKGLISCCADYEVLFSALTASQRSALYPGLKDTLKSIVKTENDLNIIDHVLTASQIFEFSHWLREDIENQVKQGMQFDLACKLLGPQEENKLYALYKDKFKEVIKSEADIFRVFQHFNTEQCLDVCNILKESASFFLIFQEGFSLDAFKTFDLEKYNTLTRFFKTHFDVLFKQGMHFKVASMLFSSEESHVLYKYYKNKFIDIIKTEEDLIHILKYFSHLQCYEILDSIKKSETFFKIFNNDDILNVLQKNLVTEKYVEIINFIKGNLKELLQQNFSFRIASQILPKDERADFFASFQNLFTTIIKNPNDFGDFINNSTPIERDMILKSLKEEGWFKTILKEADDFARIFTVTHEDKHFLIFNFIKEHLHDFSGDHVSFVKVFKFLQLKHLETACDIFKNHFFELFETTEKYLELVNTFPSEKASLMHSFFVKENFELLVINSFDFHRFNLLIRKEQRAELFKTYPKEKFKELIKNCCDLKNVLEFLTQDEAEILCASIKEQFRNIITTGNSYSELVRYLEPCQKRVVVKYIKQIRESLSPTEQLDFFPNIGTETVSQARLRFFGSIEHDSSQLIREAFEGSFKTIDWHGCTCIDGKSTQNVSIVRFDNSKESFTIEDDLFFELCGPYFTRSQMKPVVGASYYQLSLQEPTLLAHRRSNFEKYLKAYQAMELVRENIEMELGASFYDGRHAEVEEVFQLLHWNTSKRTFSI